MYRLCKLIPLVALAVLCCAPHASAAYPDRPITMIIGFGAGGGTDLPGRLVARAWEKVLGQPVVVQNVLGAGGTEGARQVATSKADGYTVGYMTVGTMATQPHMQNLPYNRDSFDYIGLAVEQPQIIITPHNAPWKNIEEMVSVIRKEPDKYVAGVTGLGNLTHLPIVALAKHFGLSVRIIPYRTTPIVIKDMMAGRIMLYATEPAMLHQVDVKGLVQLSYDKHPDLAMPSAKDIGLPQPFTVWHCLVAPKGLPEDIKKTLIEKLGQALSSPEFIAEAKKLNMAPKWIPGEEFRAWYDKEFEAYGKMIKEFIHDNKNK